MEEAITCLHASEVNGHRLEVNEVIEKAQQTVLDRLSDIEKDLFGGLSIDTSRRGLVALPIDSQPVSFAANVSPQTDLISSAYRMSPLEIEKSGSISDKSDEALTIKDKSSSDTIFTPDETTNASEVYFKRHVFIMVLAHSSATANYFLLSYLINLFE